MQMFELQDQEEILRLAAKSVASLGRFHAEATYLVHNESQSLPSNPRPAIDRQVAALGGRPGQITIRYRSWAEAYPLRFKSRILGYLVLSSRRKPTRSELLLLNILFEQTSSALANVARYNEARHAAQEPGMKNSRHARSHHEHSRTGPHHELSGTVADLELQTRAHEALSSALAAGDGEYGLALALQQLTGLATAVEDRFGNPQAWAGPDRPDPYPKPDDQQRAELLRRAASQRRPIRDRNRIIALAQPQNEVLGLIALIDPQHTAGHYETFVLQQAATFLAMEMAHRRSLAEVELRLRRELVEDVLSGHADESTFDRAAAIGHDLHQPHYVVAVQWEDPAGREAISTAVSTASRTLDLNPLQAWREGMVVLLVPGRLSGEELYLAVSKEVGPAGAIGVGGRSDALDDFPRSLRQCLKALEVRRSSQRPHGATTFDELGFYRILGTGRSSEDVRAFVSEWIGPLLDYDRRRNTNMAGTLSRYLECGGNYDNAAQALNIHRSTLRYRLRRIREITDLDLADVDSRLNLHVATRAWRILDNQP